MQAELFFRAGSALYELFSHQITLDGVVGITTGCNSLQITSGSQIPAGHQ